MQKAIEISRNLLGFEGLQPNKKLSTKNKLKRMNLTDIREYNVAVNLDQCDLPKSDKESNAVCNQDGFHIIGGILADTISSPSPILTNW